MSLTDLYRKLLLPPPPELPLRSAYGLRSCIPGLEGTCHTSHTLEYHILRSDPHMDWQTDRSDGVIKR